MKGRLFMKNIFACIICCIFIFFNLISCDTQYTSSEPTVFTQDTLYLKSSDVLLSEDFEDIICIDKNAQAILIFGYNEDGDVRAEITDTSFRVKSVYDIAFNEYEKVLTACLMKNGNISILTSENGDCCLNIYDIKSKKISTYNLSDNICEIAYDSENKPVVVLKDHNITCIAKINDTEILDITKIGEISSEIYYSCTGAGKYSVIAVFSDALYGLDNEEWVKLCSFKDNDFAVYNIKDILTMNENEFFVLLDDELNNHSLRILSEGDISEKGYYHRKCSRYN